MYHEYPYTTYFHDIDKMCECLKQVGYRLEVDANALKLIDSKGNVISTVVISYADKALTDVDGTPIKSYILDAAVGETTLVLTKGNGNATVLTIPFATKAEKDVLGKDLTAYAYALSVVGDKLVITKGDSTTYEITIPFAVKASTDENGKAIDTYAATLAIDGNNLVLKDSENRELARLTAPYATNALNDADGDEIASTYAATLEAGATNVTLKSKDGSTLSTITVPFATKAATDQQGNNFISDYAEKIVVDGDGKRIGLEAHDGTRLATITVPFATEATNATNAIQQVQVQGDQIIFTTFGGQSFTITSPYSVKAQKDDVGNTIKNTYIAHVVNNPSTGAIEFYDATNNLITSLTPTVTAATTDNYGNNIADYIKTILASANSDYVTVTHGDGTVDTITINYAVKAWKDTNGNVIKNSYVKRLACLEDVDDGHWKLVAYNGDTPEAELWRIELTVYQAQRAIGDENGVNIAQKNAAQDQRMSDIEDSISNLEFTRLNDQWDNFIPSASLGDHLEYDGTTGKIQGKDLFSLYESTDPDVDPGYYHIDPTQYDVAFPLWGRTLLIGEYYKVTVANGDLSAYGTIYAVDPDDSSITFSIDCSGIDDVIYVGDYFYIQVDSINGGEYICTGYKELSGSRTDYERPIKVGDYLAIEDDKLNVKLPEPRYLTKNKVLTVKNVSGTVYEYQLDSVVDVYTGWSIGTNSDITWNGDVSQDDIVVAAMNYTDGNESQKPVAISINTTYTSGGSIADPLYDIMLYPSHVYTDPNSQNVTVIFSNIIYDGTNVTLYRVKMIREGSPAQVESVTIV